MTTPSSLRLRALERVDHRLVAGDLLTAGEERDQHGIGRRDARACEAVVRANRRRRSRRSRARHASSSTMLGDVVREIVAIARARSRRSRVAAGLVRCRSVRDPAPSLGATPRGAGSRSDVCRRRLAAAGARRYQHRARWCVLLSDSARPYAVNGAPSRSVADVTSRTAGAWIFRLDAVAQQPEFVREGIGCDTCFMLLLQTLRRRESVEFFDVFEGGESADRANRPGTRRPNARANTRTNATTAARVRPPASCVSALMARSSTTTLPSDDASARFASALARRVARRRIRFASQCAARRAPRTWRRSGTSSSWPLLGREQLIDLLQARRIAGDHCQLVRCRLPLRRPTG